MFTSILIFIGVLALLVLVHEIGHFVTARWMGVAVEEFGIGFPPRLFAIRRKSTLYSINLIPLGGFVRIKGEGGDHAQEQDSFAHKPARQRVLILGAGVLMNALLAFVLLSIGFMYGVPQELGSDPTAQQVSDPHLVIIDVEQGSPAAAAGIRPGDILSSLNGERVQTPDEVIAYVRAHSATPITLVLKRGDQEVVVSAQPAAYGSHENAILGISTIRAGIVRYGFFEAWYQGAKATVALIIAVVAAFVGLLLSLLQGEGIGGQVSGPVGVAVLTNQVAQLGIPYLINFTAMLSVNLGILNSIPFPALDGGRILFVLLEKIKGSPINVKVEGLFHHIGFVLLIVLVLFITYQDFLRYGGQILNSLSKLVG